MKLNNKISLRKSVSVALCLAVAVFAGCGDDPADDPVKPEISLAAPADNAAVDLSAVSKVAFSWNKAEGITAYTLRFHTAKADAPASNVKFEAGDKTSCELTSAQLDDLMFANTTVKAGETGDMYWAVTGAGVEATVQTRKISITRLPVSTEPFIKLSNNAVTIPATAGEPVTVKVDSNVDWAVVDDAAWLTATKADGAISLTATPNEGADRRTATVTVSGAGAESQTIAVTQLVPGEEATLYVEPSSLTFKAKPDGPQEVGILSNVAWMASVDGDWLAVTPASGTGEGVVTLTVQPNTTGKARSAVLTVKGEGVSWPSTINVTQLAEGTGDASALPGTWHMVKSEGVHEYEGIPITYEFLNGESFTLLDNGTWTGDMQFPGGAYPDPGGVGNSWRYEGGALIVNESTHNVSWPVTVAGKELILEIGVAGKDGYQRVTYSRDAVAVPPMPDAVTPYKGAESIFTGTWVFIKEENCTSSDTENGTDPFWENNTYRAADEVRVLTINADHTYSMKEIGENPETGTWSFNAASGVISIHGMPMYTAEASCTASQLVWVEPRHIEDDHDLVFGRSTYSKKGN